MRYIKNQASTYLRALGEPTYGYCDTRKLTEYQSYRLKTRPEINKRN